MYDELLTVTVPEGEFGTARVSRFEVSEAAAQLSAVRSAFQGGGRGYVPPGVYSQLIVNGRLWMSDTPDERRDHLEPLMEARQHGARTALVSGLGLGMVVGGLLRLESIESVTVVELNTDVIQLVGRHYQQMAADLGKSFEVVCGDAMDPSALFSPGSYWDIAWHDVWADLCTDNLDEMSAMARRYVRRVGWQGFWGRDLLRQQRRQENLCVW